MPDQLRLEQAVLLGACPVQSKTSAAASKTHRVRPAEPADVLADRDRLQEGVQGLAQVALLPAEVAAHPVAPALPVEAADPPVPEGLARARQQAVTEVVRKQAQQEQRKSLAGRW